MTSKITVEIVDSEGLRGSVEVRESVFGGVIDGLAPQDSERGHRRSSKATGVLNEVAQTPVVEPTPRP